MTTGSGRARTLAAFATMGEVVVDGVTPERIRERAFAIYQSRRGNGGDAVSDWLQAERELATEAARGPAEAGRRRVSQGRARRNGRVKDTSTTA